MHRVGCKAERDTISSQEEAAREGLHHPPRHRATIVDLARELGLSVASISYALNGKPGVSQATRARVQQLAEQRGWMPSHAATSLHSKRNDVIGLVIRRDGRRSLSDFMLRFIDGLDEQFTGTPQALLLRTVTHTDDELALYSAWAKQRRVDGLVITNIVTADPRLALVSELDVPAVVVGDVRGTWPIPSVWTDDRAAMDVSVDHLIAQGHRRIARIGDDPALLHSSARSAAFRSLLAERGLPPGPDLTAGSGSAAMVKLLATVLSGRWPPTALICDSTDRAAEALIALRELGRRVPHDCALITWDNSAVCEVTTPTLTALDRDAFAYGAAVGRQMMTLLSTGAAEDCQASVSRLIHRAST